MSPVTYFNEVIREIKKVTWPTRQQTIDKTVVVIAISVIVALYLGLLDSALNWIFTTFF